MQFGNYGCSASANSVYTDSGGHITIDIVDAALVGLSPLLSVNRNIDYKYNDINMPDNCPGQYLLWGG